MLDIKSLPQFIQPFAQPLNLSEQILCVASLENLRLSLCNVNLLNDEKLNSTSRTSREILREYAKDIRLTIERLCWHKTCKGWHEIKLGGNMTKTKANDIRRKKHKEFEKNPMISEIRTENRGKCNGKNYDPFIMFKHIDNCSECDSTSLIVIKKNSIPILDTLDLLESKNNQTTEKIAFLYEALSKYLFYYPL